LIEPFNRFGGKGLNGHELRSGGGQLMDRSIYGNFCIEILADMGNRLEHHSLQCVPDNGTIYVANRTRALRPGLHQPHTPNLVPG
jgi:hypothetical protein